MYGGDAYIQSQAVGRERCVDLVQPRAAVQVEPAIDRGKCQLRRRASSDLLTRDTRVAHPRWSNTLVTVSVAKCAQSPWASAPERPSGRECPCDSPPRMLLRHAPTLRPEPLRTSSARGSPAMSRVRCRRIHRSDSPDTLWWPLPSRLSRSNQSVWRGPLGPRGLEPDIAGGRPLRANADEEASRTSSRCATASGAGLPALALTLTGRGRRVFHVPGLGRSAPAGGVDRRPPHGRGTRRLRPAPAGVGVDRGAAGVVGVQRQHRSRGRVDVGPPTVWIHVSREQLEAASSMSPWANPIVL